MRAELTAQPKGSPTPAQERLLSRVHSDVRPQLSTPLKHGAALDTFKFTLLMSSPVHPQGCSRFRSLTANIADKISTLRVGFHVILQMTFPRKRLVTVGTVVRPTVEMHGFGVSREIPAIVKPEPTRGTAVPLHVLVTSDVTLPRTQCYSFVTLAADTKLLSIQIHSHFNQFPTEPF